MTAMETENTVTENEEIIAETLEAETSEEVTETEQDLNEILEAVQADEATLADEEGIAEGEGAPEAEAAYMPPVVNPQDPVERFALQLRIVEAILFAASSPLDEKTIRLHLNRGPVGEGADVPLLISTLKEQLTTRGVELVESSGRFALRSAADLADYLKTENVKPVKLSRAMAETLAIIAYHQPVTRAEVETIRGVATSKGTLDYLMALGWVRPGRRRETPGRPLTWVTTQSFLEHFGLGSTGDLPGMEELRAAGLLDAQAAPTYGVLAPSDEAELPPAIEGLVESEPEFLPSEETVAERVTAAAEDADEEEDTEAAEEAEDEDDVASDDDDEDEDEDDLEASDDDDDDEDDEDDDSSPSEEESDEMSEDDDFDDDDEDDDFDDDDDDEEPTVNSATETVADEVEPADIDAEVDELEEEKQFA